MAVDRSKKAINIEDFEFFLGYVIAPIKEAIADIIDGGGSSSRFADLEKRVDEAQQNIVALALGLAIETGAAVNGMAGNIIVETFAGTSGYIVVSGSYDSTNHRIIA